jgi:hypothetical protein
LLTVAAYWRILPRELERQITLEELAELEAWILYEKGYESWQPAPPRDTT